MVGLVLLRSAQMLSAALLLVFGCVVPAVAQTFPDKPVTVVVPWPAGGSTDIVVRAMADVASKTLGQSVIVENKAGASGTLGPATVAATAKPDGYTIVQMPITVYRFPVMKGTKVSWDPMKDFTYIIHMTGYTFAVGVKSDSKFKTWKDVLDYAKANPGKVTYGSPGAGTSLHIGMELISAHDKVQFTHVPFKGGAETTAALAGGHVDLSVEGTTMLPLVEAGQIRLLKVWTEKRVPQWKDVPSMGEMGYPWTFDSPWEFAGPKGMDPAVVQKLHDAFKKSLDDPKVQELMARNLMPPRYADAKGYLEIVKKVSAVEAEGLKRIGMGRD